MSEADNRTWPAAVEPPEEEEELQAVPEQDPASVLAAVRAEWQKAAAEHTLDVELPGSGGKFILRLGPIGGATLSQLRQRLEASRSPQRDSNLNADVLIAACRGLYGRAAEGEPLVQLDDGDGPLDRIDARVGAALGMEDVSTARQIVFALFRNANVPDLAVAAAAQRYMEWAAGADSDVAEDVLGES